MRYVRVEFAFPPSVRHPMHDFLDDGDGWRTELLTWRRLPDETLVTLFRVVAPREWYLERLRTVDDSIDRFETAPGDDAFYLKAYERLGGPLETFFDAFVDTEFLSVPPVVYRSGGRLSFGLIGPPNQLRDVLRRSRPDRCHGRTGRVVRRPTVGRRQPHGAPARGALRRASRRVLRRAPIRFGRRRRRGDRVFAVDGRRPPPQRRGGARRHLSGWLIRGCRRYNYTGPSPRFAGVYYGDLREAPLSVQRRCSRGGRRVRRGGPATRNRDRSLEPGETYRVALISQGESETAGTTDEGVDTSASRADDGPQPPVEPGRCATSRSDLGKQGDGIARVERGYVIIVPDTEVGERVKIEVTEVKSNFAVGEVVEKAV